MQSIETAQNRKIPAAAHRQHACSREQVGIMQNIPKIRRGGTTWLGAIVTDKELPHTRQ